MPDLIPSPPRHAPRHRGLSGFWRDRRGVSAVEFALIAPVMLIFYCGLAELTQAMMAQRRLSNIASSIGDLVAQSPQLSDARLNDIFAIGASVMAPFPTATLRMCLVSVSSDATGKDTVDWSENKNSHANCPAKGAVLGAAVVPVGVLPASHSVIMAKASYGYNSPIKFILPSTLNFYRTFYLRPRKSEIVVRVS
ncbi:TadE/TadG family type IV pilus assembly protein [Caulobacter sp. DWR1-3-2b1]|uniref:TadE/TadG family type IV pilus assembly protein n=1 Tax=Caulobacter sp. DWR1-3-2b1 TaxID=2804670 RepID=UPI003CF61604